MPRTPAYARLCLIAILYAALLTGSVNAAGEPPAVAQSQTRDAVAAYEAGHFDAALQGFAAAAQKGN
ncbi:hypothetical protein, partial [Klebsiella pneumoniae]